MSLSAELGKLREIALKSIFMCLFSPSISIS